MKRKFTKTVCITLLMALCVGSLTAQSSCDDYFVDKGREGIATFPTALTRYSYTQQIFDASELSFAEMEGVISAVSFQYTYSQVCVRDSIKLYLANTTKSTFSSAEDWIPLNELELVYSGSLTFENTGQYSWITVQLSKKFIYTGDNLAIVMLDNQGDYCTIESGYTTFYGHTVSDYKTIRYHNYYNRINPASPPSAVNIENKRNNVKFEFCDKAPCNDYIVGNGTGSTSYFPTMIDAEYSYTQQIYDANELPFGEMEGAISALSFQYLYSEVYVRDSIKLYLANTTKSTFSSTSDWIPFNDLQLVYSGSIYLDNTGEDNWAHILFDTEFIYTGNNLAIVMLDSQGNYYFAGDHKVFSAHNTSGNKTIRYWSYDSIDPAAPPTADSFKLERNDVKFEFCERIIKEGCDDYTIGAGTTASYTIPISTNSNCSYSQQIFDASELGFTETEGTISEVSFQYINSTAQRRNNVSIYMANTSKSTFSSTSDWIPLNELQLVYSGELLLTDAGNDNWVRVRFDTDFIYRGRNVAFVVLDNEGAVFTGSSNTFYTHAASGNKTMQNSRSTAISPASPPAANSLSSYRNNVKFEICERFIQEGCGDYSVGEGTIEVYNIPMNTANTYSYTQQIFEANEISNNVTEGTIKSISFQYINPVAQDIENVSIYLANIRKSVFSSTSDWIPAGEMQMVFSGSLRLDNIGNDNWVTVQLPTEFHYLGKNLALIVRCQQPTVTGSSNTFYAHTASGNKTIHAFNNSGNISTNSPPTANGLSATRNNVKFEICEPLVAEGCGDYNVGNGTMEVNNIPMNTSFLYSYTQQIYDADEIGYNGNHGKLKSISFQYFNSVPQTRTFSLLFANTTKETFDSTSDWIPAEELHVATTYSFMFVEFNNHNYGDWVTIPLEEEFDYTGNNIVVVINDLTGSIDTDAEDTFLAHTATGNKTIQFFSNDQWATTQLPPTANSITTTRNNIKFEICEEQALEVGCNEYIAGNGTEEQNLPIITSRNYSYTQQIFNASELGLAGMKETIKSVSFQYFNSVAQDRSDFSLYLANTNKETFNSSSDFIPLSELELVYSGSLHLDNTGDDYWVTIPLDTEFDYTGGNLAIVALDNEGAQYTYTATTFYAHTTTDYKTIRTYHDAVAIAPSNPPAGSITRFRNNVKITSCPTKLPIQNLLVKTTQNCVANISWTAPETSSAHTYDVYCNNVKLGNTSALSYSHTVSESQTNNYCVVAVYSNGTSPEVCSSAQVSCLDICDDYIVGEGTSGNHDLPFHSLYDDMKSFTQQIYLSNELGFNRGYGTIRSISFQYFNSTALDRPNIKIYMANTSKDKFYSWNDGFVSDELQLVYDGEVHFDNTGEDYWVTIPFDAAFTYMGINVVVAVLCNETPTTIDGDVFYTHAASGLAMYYRSINDIDISTMTSNTIYYYRNNAKFEFCETEPPLFCSDHSVGSGTTETYSIPINTFYNNSYTQQIFNANEIGLNANERVINSVAFQYFNSEAQDRRNFNLYLANTTKTAFTSTSDWIPYSELQLVYSGNLHLDNTGDDNWVSIPFDTEFNYTGNNIAVVALDSEGARYTESYTFYEHTASTNKTIRYFGVEGTIDPANPPSARSITTSRNNIKFSGCKEEINDGAYLSNISVSEGTLSPEFNSTTFSYTVTVPYETTEITLEAITRNPNATLVGVGLKQLSLGSQEFKITVTAQNGSTKQTYNVEVIRGGTATLSGITFSVGYLDPVFSPTTFSYCLIIPMDEHDITYVATPTHAGSTVSTVGHISTHSPGYQIDIVVTAEDGITTQTYILTIAYIGDDLPAYDAYLSDLTVTPGVMTPEFSPTTFDYTVTVDPDVSQITVDATLNNPYALLSETANGVKNLVAGENKYYIWTHSSNFRVHLTYTVTVHQVPSRDATLSGLTIDGVLVPEFSPTKFGYVVNVPNEVTEITVGATKNHIGATVTGPTGLYNLYEGSTLFIIKVTAEDGITTQEYFLSVIRENTTSLSNNPLLSDLTVTPGTFTPEFNPAIMYYTVTVDYSVDEITIGATTSNPNATVEGLGNKEISLNYHQFMITSTSEDWSSEMHYYINVYRVPSTDATLSDLTVSEGTLTPAFDPEISDYTVTVGNDITGLDIGAIANQTNATITGTGPKTNLYLGANSFAITVTAENVITTKVYNVVVIREASDDALLSSLSVGEAYIYPAFNPISLNYSVGFLSDVSQINVSATTNHENAHILSGIGLRDLAMGDNPIDIIVLAEDEVTEIFYYLSAYRQSNDTTLSELEVSEGTLIPAFDPTILDYTVSIPYEITEIAISITTNNINAGYSGDGLKTNLIVGENPFVITVWAEDDRFSQDYNVVVTREAYVASTDASLSELTVSEGTLTPEFDPATLNYTVTVPNEITELTIGATANDDKASVAGAGLKTNLVVGTNPFAITVTAEDETTKVYNVVVTRQEYVISSDATLSNITLSAGELTPEFDPAILSYTVSVPYEITEITITAIKNHPAANVIGDGLKNLNLGNNQVTIVVLAEDGTTTKIYNVTVTRLEYVQSSDATLSDLTVSEGTLTPEFDPATLNYTVTVPYSITQITITATKNHPAATIVGDGIKALNVGSNPFSIVVIAENSSSKIYNVVVTRASISNDATLSDLTVSEGTLTPEFDPATLSYTVSVAYETTEITINATANHANATVVGDGLKDNLVQGNNPFQIIVTAEDGTTTKTYSVTVVVEGAPPCVVIHRTPEIDQTMVPLNEKIIVTFDKDITASNLSSITISPDPGNIVASVSENKLIITHDNFVKQTLHTVTIPSQAIETLAEDIIWSFTTSTVEKPDWEPQATEQTMTIIGVVRLEGIPQENEEDLLAAFIGDRCVGLASPQYISVVDGYLVFLTVGGNSPDFGKEVTFKFWDAVSGAIYSIIDLTFDEAPLSLTFIANASYGYPDNPVYFDLIEPKELSIVINNGWTWLTINLVNDNPTLIDQFKENTLDYGIQLKARNGDALNNVGGMMWVGLINELTCEEMYAFSTNSAAVLTLTGRAVNPLTTPITLTAGGWNWIGYTPQFSLPISEALEGIPNPTVNDQVKSQFSFSVFYGSSWIGSLTTMAPGVGYKYNSKSSQDATFYYPNASSGKGVTEMPKSIYDPFWKVDYAKFANNMTILASLEINEIE
ncbi:cadherin-like beta sandwich domain-containing protein, partial [Bacteroidales bacterium OttesenSCG-928-K03]|nr:cadherin-like beta sandwich domain-containing protein [Bacteroidales bacterium OttesenSCG-928-K03]